MSNSDSKSHHTIFSAKPKNMSSRSAGSSPPGSPAQTPIQPQARDMEEDLRGIGCQTKEHIKSTFSDALPIHSLQARSKDHTSVKMGADSSRGRRRGSQTANQGRLDRDEGSSPTSDVPTIYENLSSLEDSDDSNDDIPLEKIADNSLIEWFGIRLSRLARPIRVVYVFEMAKEQCTNILRDEGVYLYGDVHTERDACHDGESASGSQGHGHHDLRLLGNQAPLGWVRKRPGDGNGDDEGIEDEGSGSEQPTKRGGHNKRRRIVGEYGCPYRKRNPLRFNIRDHEQCANKSFKNMTEVK